MLQQQRGEDFFTVSPPHKGWLPQGCVGSLAGRFASRAVSDILGPTSAHSLVSDSGLMAPELVLCVCERHRGGIWSVLSGNTTLSHPLSNRGLGTWLRNTRGGTERGQLREVTKVLAMMLELRR